MVKKIKNKRISYLEFLRIISAFLVIFNHTLGYSLLYKTADSIFSTYFYTFFVMITRINVPIFLMISGSLLLEKEESIKDIFKKRIVKTTLLILVFSGLYVVFNNLRVKNIFVSLIVGNINGSYWFLYSYLTFLIMLPILKKLVKNLEEKDFKYLLIIHFVMSSIWPFLKFICSICFKTNIYLQEDFALPIIMQKSIFYPLIGYYIDKKINIKNLNKGKIFNMLAITLLAIFISSTLTYIEGVTKGYTYNYVQMFDYVIAIFTFIFIKYLFIKFFNKENIFIKIINLIGPLTLGIYLLEPLLRTKLNSIYSNMFSNNRMIIYYFGYSLFAMIICGLITFILKKIPFIKKIL